MAREQKPNLSSVELPMQRDLAKRKKEPCRQGHQITRTLSFEGWADTGPISDASPPSPISLYQEPTLPRVQTPSQVVKHPTSSPGHTNWTKNVVPIFETPTHDRATPPPHRLDLIKPNNITSNYSGTKRKAPSSSNATATDIVTKNASVVDDFFCEACQISCSGTLTFKQHLIGRRHKAKLTWMREQRNNGRGSKENTRSCVVCKICCPDKIALEMHLKGQRHKAKLQELEIGEETGTGVNAKKILRCEVCLVHCMNEDNFKMHLMGKPHASRLMLKRGGLV